MRIAVVTASIGGIDVPKVFPNQSIKVDFFSFTNENMPFPMDGLSNRLKAKYFKMQAHKLAGIENNEYDFIVWIDGNVQLQKDNVIAQMIDRLTVTGFPSDIVLAPHPSRTCVYEESSFIINQIAKGDRYLAVRYNPESLRKEAELFRSWNYPENNGLYWCGFFARRNTKPVNDFFDDWWNQNLLWADFDQTNFCFLARRHKIKIAPIEFGNFYENENYKLVNHSKLM